MPPHDAAAWADPASWMLQSAMDWAAQAPAGLIIVVASGGLRVAERWASVLGRRRCPARVQPCRQAAAHEQVGDDTLVLWFGADETRLGAAMLLMETVRLRGADLCLDLAATPVWQTEDVSTW